MALKRITSVVEDRHLGHIRVWIEDLAAIVAIVRQVAPEISMTVDGEYKIDEVNDLISTRSG
jgi:hypothetical protein